MKEAIDDYDPAAALDGPESISIFMEDAFETGDAEYIVKAMGVVARAKGMTELAQETGLSREQLIAHSAIGKPHAQNHAGRYASPWINMTARQHVPPLIKTLEPIFHPPQQ